MEENDKRVQAHRTCRLTRAEMGFGVVVGPTKRTVWSPTSRFSSFSGKRAFGSGTVYYYYYFIFIIYFILSLFSHEWGYTCEDMVGELQGHVYGVQCVWREDWNLE